ncbi:glycosyltransferase involved in cell wall biosynthesis [Winogradskyella pacifica]|uniref:Glycosyltransferase involved in cell wall biosynthesis n=1 Tax=Winogradskyella pacifica TaxID=664642 RepID=A0A3D9N5K5_9FLAO|nr:glycosyltransferase family 1 protein [Winogradskyella pacifica]REE27442.1 glycosyltransferase involved in cell wall biosynthesis [Winogradskyella pacifica]
MQKTVNYILRKSQPQYHSIESLYTTIINKVAESFSTEISYTKYTGGSPITILRNCIGFKASKTSIVHITGDVHYLALVTGSKTVLTIHDIGSALKGGAFKKLYIKLLWFWIPALFVKRIIVISEFTKKELTEIIPFAKRKIQVVSNPVNEAYTRSDYTFNNELPTILCVGTKSNKNLERIFNAVTGLKCQLHIIGQLTANQKAQLDKLMIPYLNGVQLSQQEIIDAYAQCDMLCFPSTYEGFGMPIIEAQATGRPVVTSNFGAMLEVAQNSASLVDPYSVTSIRNGIERIMLDVNYRNSLINKGYSNIQRFQLKTIAKQYIKIYKEL